MAAFRALSLFWENGLAGVRITFENDLVALLGRYSSLAYFSFNPKISSVQLDAFILNVWFSRIFEVKWFRDNEFAIKP